MRVVMKFISMIFHPLLMASYMAIILAYMMPESYGVYSDEFIWRIVLAFIALTATFPSLTVLGLWLVTPWVSDLELTDRKERIIPFFVFIFFYGIAIKVLIINLSLGYIVQTLMISAIVMIFIMVIISLRFKISIHCAAIWSLTGICLGMAWRFPLNNFFYVSLIAIVCGGLITTSRLYLGYHTPKEAWVGSFYGFLFNVLVVILFF